MSGDDIRPSILPGNVIVRNNLQPGDLGYIVYLHGMLYSAECGWDHTFEAYVAEPLARFAKSRTERERIWILEKEGKIVGSIAIVAASAEQAQLRWLLLHPVLRGSGIGRILVEDAIDFCRGNGYHSVFLWTEARLTVAGKLYVSVGFRLTEEKTHELWGTRVTEQRYELKLA